MIREFLGQVLATLLRNKLRSLLTMAGIAWGVASIVLIVAMGDGFREGQRNNTRSLGENLVIVFNGRTERQAGGQRAGRVIRVTYKDVEDIRREAFLVRLAIPELRNQVTVRSPYNSGAFEINGVEPAFTEVRTIPIDQGRFLNEQEEREGRRVCILGSNVRKQLFASRPGVVGTSVEIGGLPFVVIGLMAEKNQNSSYSGRDADKVIIPYRTMARDLPPKETWYEEGYLSNFVYSPKNLAGWEGAQKQVKRILARNHRFDPLDAGAVRMWDTIESAKMVDGLFNSMTAFLGTIALVTLTLGGVGVMNIMLVSVTERTPEIGVRKALGATRRRILADFLFEGMILALVSGAAGWVFSWGLASLVNRMPLPEMFAGLPVRMETTLMAFGALLVVAVASSFFPALRAASLTPVEALRYER
ncbi:MAG: ABC transporter permease [Bryobacteraceae bacterium]